MNDVTLDLNRGLILPSLKKTKISKQTMLNTSQAQTFSSAGTWWCKFGKMRKDRFKNTVSFLFRDANIKGL